MKHFEASQRYLCSWPNGLPAWTSLGVAFISLAADIFKLAHLLSTRIYKQTLLTFLKNLPPSKSLSQSQGHILFCLVGWYVLSYFLSADPEHKLRMGRDIFYIF